ncbi:MAG: hypothetical protein ACRCVX_02230 [Shewanella sp.]
MKYAYAVFFSAFTGAIENKRSLVYRTEAPMMTGEALSTLADEVARSAVGNRLADSVSGVVIHNVSLIGYSGEAPKEMPSDLISRLKEIACGNANTRKRDLLALIEELEGGNAS